MEILLILIVLSSLGLGVFWFLSKKNASGEDANSSRYKTMDHLLKAREGQAKPNEASSTLLDKATVAIESQAWEEALELLLGCLKSEADNPELHRKLAQVFLATGAYNDACEAYRQIIELAPEDWTAWEGLMSLYWEQENYTESVEVAEHILKANPNNLEAHFIRVQGWLLSDEEEKAIQWLGSFLNEKEMNTEPKAYKGLATDGDKRRAQRYLAQAYRQANRLNEAIEILNSLIGDEKNNDTRHTYQLATVEMLVVLKRHDEAITLMRQLLQSSGVEAARHQQLKELMVTSLLQSGRHLMEEATPEQAITTFMEALNYAPKNDRIYFQLGMAYKAMKKMLASQEALAEAAFLKPHEANYHLELAYVCEELNQVDASLRHYEECLRLKPDSSQAAFGAGTCWGLKENYTKAIHYLKKATELSPYYVDALYNLGVAYENVEQYDKAKDLYKKVLVIDSSHLEAKSNLAHLKKTRKAGLF